jgi:O2-independent ubiquinone biosynthesis accessory factor UbiT
MRPLPLAGLQPLLGLAIRTMKQQHGDVFDRLGGLGDLVFLIDPTDLPFAFELCPSKDVPTLKAIAKPNQLADGVNAAIRGPLLSLLSLLEGRVDGDALFFSRELTIEGDTEAVLALRNAVDGADIDILSDALSPLGPIAGPARRIARHGETLFARLTSDLETLARSVRAPAARRLQAQSADIRELNERVDDVTRKVRRAAKTRPTKAEQ